MLLVLECIRSSEPFSKGRLMDWSPHFGMIPSLQRTFHMNKYDPIMFPADSTTHILLNQQNLNRWHSRTWMMMMPCFQRTCASSPTTTARPWMLPSNRALRLTVARLRPLRLQARRDIQSQQRLRSMSRRMARSRHFRIQRIDFNMFLAFNIGDPIRRLRAALHLDATEQKQRNLKKTTQMCLIYFVVFDIYRGPNLSTTPQHTH